MKDSLIFGDVALRRSSFIAIVMFLVSLAVSFFADIYSFP